MRTLYILRHAKSSWDDPGQDDHDRPLAPRGRRATQALAGHIAASAIRPDIVLCSSSRRTRETLAGIGVDGEHVIDRSLYDVSAAALLERLHQVSPETASVMLIGHNPSAQMLILRLASGSSDQLLEVAAKFPTGALATLSFDCDWSQLGPGVARLTDYVRPKALTPR